VLSSTLLGTDHAVVIHHTDCGLGPTTDEAVRSDLAEAGVEVGNLWLGTFDDLDGSVREDVAHLRAVLGRRDIVVSGFVYDVSTGRLRQVDLT
jgi:carbonic anhydrase